MHLAPGVRSSPGRSNCCDLLQQVAEDVLTTQQVGARDALIGQVACVGGLPQGHQQGWRAQYLLQRRRHLPGVPQPLLSTHADCLPQAAFTLGVFPPYLALRPRWIRHFRLWLATGLPISVPEAGTGSPNPTRVPYRGERDGR